MELRNDAELRVLSICPQIENKMTLGINHITKEEFLPAFFIVHQQTMTVETISSGFRATVLVPFNPERVLENLGPVVDATPLTRSSQASWNPQTPKTLPQIEKQSQLVLSENRKRRRSSASSGGRPLQQLSKGFENVVHEKALLMVEVAALRAENQPQKQKGTQENSKFERAHQ
jgi:hypothetical protein